MIIYWIGLAIIAVLMYFCGMMVGLVRGIRSTVKAQYEEEASNAAMAELIAELDKQERDKLAKQVPDVRDEFRKQFNEHYGVKP